MAAEQKRRMRPIEKGVLYFILLGGLVGVGFMFYLNAHVDDWKVQLNSNMDSEKAQSLR
ncbi:hypothetical protein EV586_104322 [Tumebacillus sp. BK434]|uniref:hypothetical protein n=1 Tax=Tumebacillus sp. BK434 TaxID=2512169 RepID=UPI0010D0C6C2|nr:hypothetical protein [Tumebacillus sp. BK434]TCP54701.1 hypothetical protein EV586_104322 [Tumebacillus sp. BK434]